MPDPRPRYKDPRHVSRETFGEISRSATDAIVSRETITVEDRDTAVGLMSPTKPQLSDQFSVPTVPRGWFADHDPATRTNETRRELQRGLRRAEASRHGGVEHSSRRCDDGFDIARDDLDAIRPPHPHHHAAEEIGPLAPTIDQGDRKVGTIMGDDEARDTPSSPQIDHRPGHALERVHERAGVGDHLVDRTVAEEAEPVTLSENIGDR